MRYTNNSALQGKARNYEGGCSHYGLGTSTCYHLVCVSSTISAPRDYLDDFAHQGNAADQISDKRSRAYRTKSRDSRLKRCVGKFTNGTRKCHYFTYKESKEIIG